MPFAALRNGDPECKRSDRRLRALGIGPSARRIALRSAGSARCQGRRRSFPRSRMEVPSDFQLIVMCSNCTRTRAVLAM